MAGHSGQFTPVRLAVDTVIHTTLVGLEPTTFRLLVRRATSSATEPTSVVQWVGGEQKQTALKIFSFIWMFTLHMWCTFAITGLFFFVDKYQIVFLPTSKNTNTSRSVSSQYVGYVVIDNSYTSKGQEYH